MTDQQGNVAEFLVDLKGFFAAQRFSDEPVFAEIVAVVGAEEDRGIVLQFFIAQCREKLAHPEIDLRDLGLVKAAHVLDVRSGILRGVTRFRPEDGIAVLVPGVRLEEFAGGVPRFMRVESVDPEKELFGRVLQPFHRRTENCGGRIRALLLVPAGVPPIAVESMRRRFQFFGRAGQVNHRRGGRLKGIVALARDVLHEIKPALEPKVVFKKVEVVGDQGGGEPMLLEDLREHGEFVGQFPPVIEWKGVAAGEDFDAIDKGRERAEPEIREHGAFAGELIQLGSRDRLLPRKPRWSNRNVSEQMTMTFMELV